MAGKPIMVGYKKLLAHFKIDLGQRCNNKPKTAERLRLKSERLAELRLGNSSLRAPIWIVPGAENVVTLHLGYGRKDREE